MDTSMGTIVLLVVTVMVSAVAGAPLSCPGNKRGDCYCSYPANNGADVRLACPSQLPPPRGRMKLEVDVLAAEAGRSTGAVSVICYTGCRRDNLSQYLGGLELGRLATVKFTDCPIPQEPFSQLFESMGLTGVRRLSLVRSSGREGEQGPELDFSNLTELTSLQVQRGPALHLRPELLQALPSLRRLDFLGLANLSLHEEAFSSLSQLASLEIRGCRLTSLHPLQFRGLSAIQNLSLHGNSLEELPAGLLDDVTNLQGLDLSKNRLLGLPPGLLDHQPGLRSLGLGQNQLLSLPDRLLAGKQNLTSLALDYNGEAGCPGARRSCSYRTRLWAPLSLPSSLLANSSIRSLSLTYTNLTTVPADLLRGCQGLEVLRVWGGSFTSLPASLLRDSPSLRLLDLSHNSLSSLPAGLLRGLPALTTLRLRGNRLASLPAGLLADLANLTTLDLADNRLADLPTDLLLNNGRLFGTPSAVTLIDFSKNRLTRFPSEILARKQHAQSDSENNSNLLTKIRHFSSLKKHVLTLATTGHLFRREMEAYRQWTGHSFLDLGGNQLAGEVSLSPLAGWLLDLSGNQITHLAGLPRDGHGARLALAGNPVACDCTAVTLQAALKGRLAWVLPASLACAEGGPLALRPPASLTCPVALGCPRPCSCTRSQAVLTVDCRARGLTRLPQFLPVPPPGSAIHLLADDNQVEDLELEEMATNNEDTFHSIARLSISGNRLVSLETESLPEGLHHLAAHDNLLAGFTSRQLAALARPGLALTIAGNPFLCSCASRDLHSFLHKHYSKVEQYENITVDCGNQTKALYSLESEDFCNPLPLLEILITVGLILTILVLLLLVHVFYRDTVLIWVFSQPWGKVFFSEDKLDKDKLYDAFLSYSHQDAEFMESHLLPGLESLDNPREHQYRCLIHGRDWVVGQMIPDQILDSVAASKRTVVLLSKDYLTSSWSRLEFEAAHAKTLRENTQRVVLLLHGPLPPSDQMDKDLQAYIKANTAIRTDDPWFWQKLRYALPRKRARAKTRSPSSDTQSTVASIGWGAQLSREGLIQGKASTHALPLA